MQVTTARLLLVGEIATAPRDTTMCLCKNDRQPVAISMEVHDSTLVRFHCSRCESGWWHKDGQPAAFGEIDVMLRRLGDENRELLAGKRVAQSPLPI